MAVNDSTREMMRIDVVLVVGGSQSLIRVVRESVVKLKRADLVTCDMRAAQTRAAELRPFAIVMPDELHAFDSAEFAALARDVGAQLIVVAGDALQRENAESIDRQLSQAFSQRRKQ
jgi:site-specific recombinase